MKNGTVNHGLAKPGTLSESMSSCLHLEKLMFNMALLLVTIQILCKL